MDSVKVRAMLKNLFDESVELETRYKEFRASADKCLDEYGRSSGRDKSKALNHYQDARAIAVYLSFEYPDKYYLFKTRMYTRFRDLVGFQESTKNAQRSKGVWKLENYARLCEDVLQAVKTDSELCSRLEYAVRNDPSCQVDDALHLLTQTIIYVGHYTDAAQILAASNHSVLNAETGDGTDDSEKTDVALNTILYGPPGTGKTYQTVNYAVSIIENEPLENVKKRGYEIVLEQYKKYKKEGLIEFVTFHQSYGYEDFVEGIKPVLQEDEAEGSALEYRLVPGVFRKFCEKAAQPVVQAEDFKLNADPTIWKVSLGGTGDNEIRRDCMDHGHIRIGWDTYGEDIEAEEQFADGGKAILNAFYNKMRIGDLVLSCYSETTIDAIGIVTGGYEWHEEYNRFKRVRPIQWLVKGIREDITAINNGSNMTLSTGYRLNISLNDVMELIRRNRPVASLPEGKKENHVFIIDEINRGNISKIFGELITLVEESKRIGKDEELRVRLPYSQKVFGVPDNVFLLGTMNTADRSIAILDTALRRRFSFVEMQPDLTPLEGVEVEGINISEMLRRMNERIMILYDREHTIGQSYFIPLRDTPTIDCLAGIFKNSIVPLLQEYFFDDYDKIRLVLADNQKPEELQFITKLDMNTAALFGNTEEDFNIEAHYIIHNEVFEEKPEAYLRIYQ